MSYYRANDQDVIGALDPIEWRTPRRIREIISNRNGGAFVLIGAFWNVIDDLVQKKGGVVERRDDEDVGPIFKLSVP